MSLERTCLISILVLGGCATTGEARATTARHGHATAGSHGRGSHERGSHERGSHEGRSSGSSGTAAAAASDDSAADEAPTAMDQSESPGDYEITRLIRVAVVADDSLSFSALNVVIVTQAGVVTLRGDVGTDAERQAIYTHARSVDGVSRVENLIAVSP